MSSYYCKTINIKDIDENDIRRTLPLELIFNIEKEIFSFITKCENEKISLNITIEAITNACLNIYANSIISSIPYIEEKNLPLFFTECTLAICKLITKNYPDIKINFH